MGPMVFTSAVRKDAAPVRLPAFDAASSAVPNATTFHNLCFFMPSSRLSSQVAFGKAPGLTVGYRSRMNRVNESAMSYL